jgi:hypothetical protein
MKVLSNTLELFWDTWSDPGDYPNAIAQRPLPDYPFPVVEGEIVVEAENEKELQEFSEISDWIWEYVKLDLKTATWKGKVEGNRCTISIDDFEAEPPEVFRTIDD